LFDLDSFGYGWRAIDIGVYHVSFNGLDLSEKIRAEKKILEHLWMDIHGAP